MGRRSGASFKIQHLGYLISNLHRTESVLRYKSGVREEGSHELMPARRVGFDHYTVNNDDPSQNNTVNSTSFLKYLSKLIST